MFDHLRRSGICEDERLQEAAESLEIGLRAMEPGPRLMMKG